MKYCSKCGNLNEDFSTYCERCGAPGRVAFTEEPTFRMKSRRSLFKFILLSVLSLGIYPLIFFTKAGYDINTIATRHDGKKTTNYCLSLFVFGILTCFIAPYVWFHRFCNRIGNELKRREIAFVFSAKNFWRCVIKTAILSVVSVLITNVVTYAIAGNTMTQETAMLLYVLRGYISLFFDLVILVIDLCFVSKIIKSLNILTADYNKRG